MPVRSFGEPVGDQARFVARGIVHYDMHVKACRDVALYLVQELAELLCAMAWHAFADHTTCFQIRVRGHRRNKTCEQRCGAMTLVVVRAPLDLSRTHRQHRLGAVQRLDLALFVDTDDQGLLGRIEIKPYNVAYLLDKLRIGRKLERLRPMWLQAEGAPDAMHRGGRHARYLRHAARAPVRRVHGLRLQRPDNDLLDAIIPDLAWRATSGLVIEAIQAMFGEAIAPQAYGLARDPHSIGDCTIAQPFRCAQHDFCPLRIPV